MVIQDAIETKLAQGLSPEYMDVINESSQHNVPDGSESHFKVIVVSDGFNGLRLIQRQQMVYRLLAEEMAGSVHALTMQTLTPKEWQADQPVKPSPACMGGSKQ